MIAIYGVEILLALAAGLLFSNERERVQEIWPGCLMLMVDLFFLIFTS